LDSSAGKRDTHHLRVPRWNHRFSQSGVKIKEKRRMQQYICPTCGQAMERDLLVFIAHTDQHIVDEIKKRHPEWITKDGFCLKCLEYFKKAMGK
jgi:hypothetical protein